MTCSNVTLVLILGEGVVLAVGFEIGVIGLRLGGAFLVITGFNVIGVPRLGLLFLSGNFETKFEGILTVVKPKPSKSKRKEN